MYAWCLSHRSWGQYSASMGDGRPRRTRFSRRRRLAIHQYSKNAATASAMPPTRAGTATATGKAFFAAAEGAGEAEAVITCVTTDCRLARCAFVGDPPSMMQECHGRVEKDDKDRRLGDLGEALLPVSYDREVVNRVDGSTKQQ